MENEQELWTDVDQYIKGLLIPTDPLLEAALQASAQANFPAIQVTPTQGRLLALLARTIQARNILEIGTLGGYSTIWLARALAPGGKLVSLEADPQHAQVARSNITRAGLADSVEIRLGMAKDSLSRLAAEERPPFDLAFIDADKVNTRTYFEWALRLTRPGGLIVVDNVIRHGRVIESESEDQNVQGMRQFMERLAVEKRVTATVIQTVGEKGYDGFCVALVNLA
jgi:predicted O-methyltransferase YrrM